MNFEDLQNAIQKAEIELKKIQLKGDEYILEFMKLVPEFLSEWTSILVKRNIENSPMAIKSLGSKNIGILKKKISDFDQSLPVLTKKQIDTIKWPHQVDLSNEELKKVFGYDLGNKFVDSLDHVIRMIIGQLGKMLIDFGLTKVEQYSEWKESNGEIYYAYGIPDQFAGTKGIQLKALKEKYREVIDLYIGALKDYKKAEEDKRIAEAKYLWEKA